MITNNIDTVIKHRCLMKVLFFLLVVVQILEARSPNIVYILADDLGWHELGCYGNTYNETPNVDKLAAGGMLFSDAYAAAPVCSPYRASLLTGQYPARIGILKWLDKFDFDKNLPRQYITIAEQLKTSGYSTGIVGKWHVSCYADDGDPDPVTPDQQGFDEVMAGATTYIGNGDYWLPYWIMPRLPQAPVVLDSNYPNDEYLVDRCNYEAVNFIERHKEEPFFLYLSHYAVHTKLDGKPNLVSHFESKPGSGTGAYALKNNPHLAAQLFTIDQGVGQIISKLTELGLLEDTIVIFTSDNGGAGNVTSNAPLRGAKGNLYEGGIRIPMIMNWSGHISSGGICSKPVVSCDFYPTFSEILDIPLPQNQHIDGVSLKPLFADAQASIGRESLYWYYPHNNQSAVRNNDWKLIERLDTGKIELYNLADDLSEAINLTELHPDKAMAMLQQLRDWRASVPKLVESTGDGKLDIQELKILSENWLK